MERRLNQKSGTNNTFFKIMLLDKHTEPILVIDTEEPFGKVTEELDIGAIERKEDKELQT